MITILVFILILGILVLVHEFGHFIVAKKSGLTVEEFGFGFPPRIFSWKSGETIYSINLLPLGGFVKILGEDGSETNNSKSFSSKSIVIRSLITAAGVMMNFALGAMLLIIGFYIGLPQVVSEENETLAKNVQIQIIAINHNSPAEKAGLKLGDSIENFSEILIFQDFISKNKGQEINLKIKRGQGNLEIKTVPRVSPPEGEGALGIALAKTGLVSYPWYQSVWLGIKSSFIITWEIIKGFFGLIKNLLVSGKVPQEVAGPVGIAVLAGQATALGFVYLLQLVALISLNLAVLNLIPFPALDGGRLLFLAIEKIKGSKVNPKIENAIHSVGIVLLLVLVALITYRDILKLL
ncbi:MAG: RIP metalloprotease RseP [Parcubacteria group bacterium]|nr:RIP metalloprotease RseP [Parcubacteria group bacterium]